MKRPVPGGRKEGRHGLFMPKISEKLQAAKDSAVLTTGLQGKSRLAVSAVW